MGIGKMSIVYQRPGFRVALFRWPAMKLFFMAAFCIFASLAADAANFTTSLDRDTIALGESATLSLTFQGGQPGNVPTPDIPGLDIVSTGTSQSFSFNNGQSSSVFTMTYSVTPERTGTFIIPAMAADIGGQQIRTQPLKLTVVSPGSPSAAQINSGTQVAFMRLSLPGNNVYPGQVISGQLQIFFRDDVQNEGNFQFTAMPADGFTVGKLAQGQSERTQIGNRIYTVIPVSVALTANKTGTLRFGPVSANVVLVMNNANQQWGPFGNFFGGEQKQVTLAASPATIQSLPLPSQNVPANFNGAVGDYSLTVTAGPTNVAVGDPVTVRIEISGRGDIDSLLLPDQPGWKNFKIFSPTSKTELSDDLGDEGTKTFEEIVTPDTASVRELPAFSFSFFNPDDGRYHTLTQGPIPLVVTSAGATPLPTILAAKPAESQAPQDIVPIRENLGALAQVGRPLIVRPGFVALQSVPIVAFLAALVWRKRTDHLANNPRLRRRRAVAQLVSAGLVDLNRFAAENRSDEFFATLFRLLQEQLGERLDCPAISITEADVDSRFVRMGAKPETINSLRELFQACNQARYARVQTSQELSALALKFKIAAGELQELKS